MPTDFKVTELMPGLGNAFNDKKFRFYEEMGLYNFFTNLSYMNIVGVLKYNKLIKTK